MSLPLLFSVLIFPCAYNDFALSWDTAPRWRNQEQSSLVIPQGGYVSLEAEGFDAVSLEKAVLCTNETGVWRNETEYAFLWVQEAVYGFDNFGTATYDNGVLYAPSKGNHALDGRVYAINATDGSIIWNVTVRQCDGSPCVDGNVIYVGEGFSVITGEPVPNPKAFALNKSDGSEIWHYVEPNGNGWIGSPLVYDDHVYYTTGYYNYTTGSMAGSGVYALNKTDGAKIWQQDIGFIVGSAAYHEGVLFISGSNHVSPQGQYALNATNGDIIWHVNHGPSWDASPIVYGGMVIQVVRDVNHYPYPRATFVLNETSGVLIRRFAGRGSPSTPLVHDGKIFIPDDDWRMWAFNLTTGKVLWDTIELHDGTLQDNSYCSPAAAGGAIYYQSLNGTFYVINETSGDVLWSYPLGGFGIGSPSIGDGCVFITNDSGLYAFRIGSGNGDWPMFCQNNLHQSYLEDGVECVRWPLTQPQHFRNASNTWAKAKFVWCNKTIISSAIGWKIYFFDGDGNVNVTGTKVFYVNMPIHNVAVEMVVPEKTVMSQNQTTSINVTVTNEGNYSETFNLTAYVNITALDTLVNITLASLDSITLTFIWNTTGFAKGDYTIVSAATAIPGEADVIDNTKVDGIISVSIAGDVNGDRLVDVSDLVITVGAIPSTPTYNPELWNANADINGDGKCDISDLTICVGAIPSSW